MTRASIDAISPSGIRWTAAPASSGLRGLNPCPLKTSTPAGIPCSAPSNSSEIVCARSLGSGVATASRGGLRMVHSDPIARNVAGSPSRASLASSRMACVICSSRFESGTVVIAPSSRNGSNSRLNGTCGSSNSHEPVRPVVRTRACKTSRCGPFVSKSWGTMAN